VTPPLFLVPDADLQVGTLVVDGAEGRHAADVRRIRAGTGVLVGDGRGAVADAVVVDVGRGRLTVDVARVRRERRPEPAFVVAQALAQGGRDEDAHEAMTEVGVDEVVGWQAERSIARWTDRTAQRWAATAHAAAKQSRRAWVPTVTGPVSTTGLVQRVASASLAVVLHEAATAPLTGVSLPTTGDVVVVVGPEGGVADGELDVLVGAGARACRLGPHVLRTSTAGVAAISLLSAASRWR